MVRWKTEKRKADNNRGKQIDRGNRTGRDNRTDRGKQIDRGNRTGRTPRWGKKIRVCSILCIGCICCLFLFFLSLSAAAKEPSLHAKAAVLLDGENKRVLYDKNGTDFMANASTTKILTCILALENLSEDTVVTASAYAASMPDTSCGFAQGEQFYLKDLLYSLMLESHNDSAVAIAEAVSGSVETFADRMNQKAKELGCVNSHFVTPNGLDNTEKTRTHGSCAYDLALIMQYCIQNPSFLKITQTKDYHFTDVSGQHSYQVSNKNVFLTSREGVLSGKTGFTVKAGYCYVCAYAQGNHKYTLALLACGWPNHKTYKWSDANALITYGNETFTYQEVPMGGALPVVGVTNGVLWNADQQESATSGETAQNPISYPDMVAAEEVVEKTSCLLGSSEEVKRQVVLEPFVPAPVRKNQILGYVTYTVGDCLVGKNQVRATQAVRKLDYPWALRFFLQEFLRSASF